MSSSLVRVTDIHLLPDPNRLVTRPFQPGAENVGPGLSRAGAVIDRVFALTETEAILALEDVEQRFGERHRAMRKTFRTNAARMLATVAPELSENLTTAKLVLLGAVFTQECAIEASALCNPSIVFAPGSTDAALNGTDDADFVMSVRGIGEGHRSTIGFRTGRVQTDGAVVIDPAGPFAVTADATDLPAVGSYRSVFGGGSSLVSERVLWPHFGEESSGMEDARFVRFVDERGRATYYGTYTAFDGSTVRQRLLETTDFAGFTSHAVSGTGAIGKGLALFPRKIQGRYAALTRSDRETNGVAFSETLVDWGDPHVIQSPTHAWEVVQLGNCGSPVETPDGWLILTHGVGALRTYSIGALLLDLDDPTKVIGRTSTPLLTPDMSQPGGYVPNAIYTCGKLAHGDLLVIPFGVADRSIAVATLSIAALIASM
jgi:predicted GH43/DUF377 family glycosyl hydrolase